VKKFFDHFVLFCKEEKMSKVTNKRQATLYFFHASHDQENEKITPLGMKLATKAEVNLEKNQPRWTPGATYTTTPQGSPDGDFGSLDF
jgi:hypothetical protein